MDVEVTTLPPRAGTIQSQISDELVAKIKDNLDSIKDKPKSAVAIGGLQDKEGTARTIVEAVMKRLEAQDPPVYVRTHIATVTMDDKDDKGEPVKKYRGSVSLTPDGKPSRKKRANGAAPDAPAATPPATPAATGRGRR